MTLESNGTLFFNVVVCLKFLSLNFMSSDFSIKNSHSEPFRSGSAP
jgi:hypothetical protein